MKLTAYLRTSTGNGNGDPLAAELDACRDWATANEHKIVSHFKDDGTPGSRQPTSAPAS